MLCDRCLFVVHFNVLQGLPQVITRLGWYVTKYNCNTIVIYNKKANTVNAHPYMNYQWLKNNVD